MRLIVITLAVVAAATFSGNAKADNSTKRSPGLQVLDHFVGAWDMKVTAKPAGGEAATFDAVSHRSWSRGGKFVVFDDPQEEELHMPMTYDPETKTYPGVMILGVGRGLVTGTWDESAKTMHFLIENMDKTTYRGTHRFIRDDYAEASGKVTNAVGEVIFELAYKQNRRSKTAKASDATVDRIAIETPAHEAFPKPGYINTNGIRMAVYEQGEGVPVVLCHGFPELAYSWRHQLPALAQAGYHAIAPDQRGYGLTDQPEEVEAYTIVQLCKDVVGLLDAKGIDQAVFCGHDWGGGVVWMMPLLHPNRVLGVIGVNTPLWPRPPVPPVQLLRQMRGEDNYVVAFQKPNVADRALAKDVRKTFTLFMRRGGTWNAEEFANLPQDAPERKFELLKALEAPEDSYGGNVFLTPRELAFFVDTYGRTGFSGGINWYRNIDRNWTLTKDVEYKTDVPCLYVGAENDVVLPPSSADGMERFIGDLEKKTIRNCGHWTQQEKPEEFNRIVIEWLDRKFARDRE